MQNGVSNIRIIHCGRIVKLGRSLHLILIDWVDKDFIYALHLLAVQLVLIPRNFLANVMYWNIYLYSCNVCKQNMVNSMILFVRLTNWKLEIAFLYKIFSHWILTQGNSYWTFFSFHRCHWKYIRCWVNISKAKFNLNVL